MNDPRDAGGCGTITAYNASPMDEASACDWQNVLERDDVAAGLDRNAGTQCAEWGGPDADDPGACGCVGLDLGVEQTVNSMIVRAAATAQACTERCVDDDCGLGRVFTAWAHGESEQPRFVKQVALSAGYTDTEVTVEGGPTRYLLVCRDKTSATKDDVVVDLIAPHCE